MKLNDIILKEFDRDIQEALKEELQTAIAFKHTADLLTRAIEIQLLRNTKKGKK